MKYIWLIFTIQLFGYSIIKPSIQDHEVGLVILVSIHVLSVIIFISKFKPLIRVIFLLSFFLRFVVMIVDIYFRGLINIPHSGDDTETFLSKAISISGDLFSIVESKYEFFIRLVSLIFTITENERIIFQYFNVLLGFTTVYLVYLILKRLDVSAKNITIGLLIVSFFPHALFFSGILLREMLSAFFIVSATYFLVNWYKEKSNVQFFLSIVMVLISAVFHSGTIGFLSAHIFAILFFNRDRLRFIATKKTFFIFFVLLFAVILIFGFYDWQNLSIFRKLRIEGLEDIYEVSAQRIGESAYLTGISINSLFEFLLYGPLFMIYFIASPIPLDWRGISDIIAFVLDGSFFLGTVLYILVNIKKVSKDKRMLITILFIGLITIFFIYSIGVHNAGTALRHRNKVLYLLTIIFIIVKDRKTRKGVKL